MVNKLIVENSEEKNKYSIQEQTKTTDLQDHD